MIKANSHLAFAFLLGLFCFLNIAVGATVGGVTQGVPNCPKAPTGFVAQHGQLRAINGKILNKNNKPVILRGMSLFWSQWKEGSKYWVHSTIASLKNNWKITVIRAAMGVEQGGYLTAPVVEKQKVINVIESALTLGIYVIVDWHDHNANKNSAKAIAFFTEIAQKYGNCHNLIFEPFNEPEQQDWAKVIKPYHEKVIPAIRKKSQNLILLGSRQWDQRLDEVAANPLNATKFLNIAYTVHFYAATHKKANRDLVQKAINKKLALFASECGVSEASGNGAINKTEFTTWINFLEKNGISWVAWSVSDKAESSAALKPGSNPNGKWTTAQYTPAGLFLYNTIRARNV